MKILTRAVEQDYRLPALNSTLLIESSETLQDTGFV